jgi:hypothetical protein
MQIMPFFKEDIMLTYGAKSDNGLYLPRAITI